MQRPRREGGAGCSQDQGGPEWSRGLVGGRETETETQRDGETERQGWQWLTTYGGRVAGDSAFPRPRGGGAVWEKRLMSPIRVVNVLAAALKNVKGNR